MTDNQRQKRAKKPEKKKKTQFSKEEPKPSLPDQPEESPDFGGMNLENFRRNMGCGG